MNKLNVSEGRFKSYFRILIILAVMMIHLQQPITALGENLMLKINSNNDVQLFSVNPKLKVSVGYTDLNLYESDKMVFSVKPDSLVSVSYITSSSSINEVAAERVSLSICDNQLKIANGRKISTVSIYNTAGIRIDTRELNPFELEFFDLSSYTRGHYIIQINQSSYKFVIK